MTDNQLSNEHTVQLSSGRPIPLLGFGTWQMRDDEAYDAVRSALETGYRHLDTATAYGNEEQVGRALRDSGVPRDDVFVTTKLPPDNAGRERETLEASLSDLGLDAVDLWLIHWPPGGEAGVDTWRELLRLRDEGLARAVGVSNYGAGQVDELVAATGEAPAVNQVKWSPFVSDHGLLEHNRGAGVVLEGYSPFRSASLDDPVLAEVASKHDRSPAQVILRWHLDTGVVVIPKSAQRERIEANFDVFGFRLDDGDIAKVDALGNSGGS